MKSKGKLSTAEHRWDLWRDQQVSVEVKRSHSILAIGIEGVWPYLVSPWWKIYSKKMIRSIWFLCKKHRKMVHLNGYVILYCVSLWWNENYIRNWQYLLWHTRSIHANNTEANNIATKRINRVHEMHMMCLWWIAIGQPYQLWTECYKMFTTFSNQFLLGLFYNFYNEKMFFFPSLMHISILSSLMSHPNKNGNFNAILMASSC